MTDTQHFDGIPPWLRGFFIHVVKRCANILVKWITDMQEARR